ncbi:MAG TPA: transglutaminase domain-containing protein [Tissierellaceae bacterium]
MDSLRKQNKNLIYNLLYSIMVFSLVYVIAEGIGLKLKPYVQFPVIFLSSLLVKFFIFNPAVFYSLLLFTFIIFLIIQRYFYPILFVIGEKTYALIENIIENILGKGNITPENLIPFWFLIIILVSFITSIVIFKSKKIYFLLPIYILPFLYYWYYYYDSAYWMMALFLASFIMLMGLNKYDSLKANIIYKSWFKTISIYSLITVSLALILPKTYDYIEWPWLQEKVETYFPVVKELRSYDSYTKKREEASLFDFSSTGLQEGISKLGGPVKLNNSRIMLIRSDEPVYLRGNVKQIYTGNSWQSYDTDFKKYRPNGRLNNLTSYERKSFYREKTIVIKNLTLTTQTVFSPYLPEAVYIDKDSTIFINDDFEMILPDGIYKNESYTLKVQKPYPYSVLLTKGIYNTKNSIENLDIYLQVPDNISKQIKDLVKAIVEGKKTDYEKAVAIESYLRENYKYTYDVEEVPDNVEFIHHFLFNEKKGYCTYFATAMAIMLRLEGIPSRYIEGYIAIDEVEPEIYEITGKNAHTWVEAFIEPVGWISFEPTPAYPVENRMTESLNSQENGINAPSNAYIPINGEKVIDRAPKDAIIDDMPMASTENDYTNDTSKASKSNEKTVYMFGILMLLLSIRLIRGLIYYKFEDIKYKKLSNNEKIIFLYRQIIKIIELFGYPQKSGETHYEYAERIANKFYYTGEKNIKKITDIFVKSKYSTLPISDDDVKELEDFKYSINKQLRKYLGLAKYLYRKYIKLDLKVKISH